jgi:acylphosphatase
MADAEMPGEVQRGFIVRGRVQGVYFRAWTRGMAQELGVRGWVRNRPDGTVEAHGAGGAETMREFQARLGMGPAASRVDEVEAIASEVELPSLGFEIRY